jgi:hypothetical protein
MNEVLTQLHKIALLQCHDSEYFTNGLFEVERRWAGGFYQRKDNTGFFTASIGFTLKRYESYFSDEELKVVKNILNKMELALTTFKNKDGHSSYNFWQTNPSRHFPAGNFAKHFKFFMIPDDIDDSAMIHLVKVHPMKEQIALKDKMTHYAIGNLKWPDLPVKGYEQLKVYNTFFVKNMPSAFDICALTNVLYFVYHYGLPLNEQDEHSLRLIIKCLEDDDHLRRPYSISPYYPNSVIIIYHIVRLISDFKILEQFNNQLIHQIKHLLDHKSNEMEKLLLSISLEKLQKKSIQVIEPSAKHKKKYPFFVAGIIGEVKPKWLRYLSFSNFTHIKYSCEAYSEVLWLEHLLLKRIFKNTILNN